MFGTPPPTFIAYDAAGSALWAGAYIACGFFFAANLDKVVKHISGFANAVVLIFGIPLLVLLAEAHDPPARDSPAPFFSDHP
jgi:membrane protein DedA with SNARE-associated domain